MLYHDGVVYVGGYFDQVGGQSRDNLAAIDASTGAPLPWNPGAGGYIGPYFDPYVSSLLADGQTLFVGGLFSEVGGETRHNLAALDVATGAALDWDPGASTGVSALAGNGGTPYAGGRFLAAADQPQAYIVAIAIVEAQTDPATAVSVASATLNGVVTAYADPETTVAFEWGTTSGGPYPNELAASPSPVGATDPVTVSAILPNLTPGVTYYFRGFGPRCKAERPFEL
jgi:hypothetical protein